MKWLFSIFVFFCLFPYLDLLGLGTDTQPNALIFGALILLYSEKKKLNTPLILLWLTCLCSLFLIFKNNLSFFHYLKNVLNYMSPAVLALASYTIYKNYDFNIPFKLFLGVCISYTLIAYGQMYIDPNIVSFAVNETRGVMVNGRGVISLCPEPAFYGSLCLFFMCFSLLSYSKKQNFIIIPLLLFQIIALSQSATASAVLVLTLVIFTVIQILKFRLSYMLYAGLFLAIAIPFYNTQMDNLEESRIGKITADFIEDPLMITKIDESIGVRFSGAVAPYLAAKHRYFLPMGMGNYKSFLKELYNQGLYRKFLNPYTMNEQDRLTGSINLILFQLGFIGLMFPIAIYLSYSNRLGEDKYLFSMLLLICLLFTQLQLMHSMIGFLLGFVIYKTRAEKAIA